MIDVLIRWAIPLIGAALISGVINSFVLHYIRKYIDDKMDEQAKAKADRELRRRKMNMAEQERRHAAGRLLFWLHHAIVKGEHNGELEAAMEGY